MTTDTSELPSADATLSDLLKWTADHGYAGLSDEQIERVIEYRANVLAQSEQLKTLADQMAVQHEQVMQQAAQVASDMQASLVSAIQLRPNFEVVSDNEQAQA